MIQRSPQASYFVGRDAELRLLGDAFQRSIAGKGGIVVIHGEAGIGKTSLARAFAGEAEVSGAQVAWGRGYEGAWTPPYTLWAEALAGLVTDIECDTKLDTEEDQFLLHRLLVSKLKEYSLTTPLVLIIEDIQWSDAPSLELIRHLAHFGLDSRLLLVATFRSFENEENRQLGQLLSQLQRNERVSFIALEGLEDKEVAQLLEIRQTRSDDAYSKQIRELTNGNPLMISEVAQLGDQSDSIVSVSRASENEVRRLIRYRLDRLSTEAQTVLNRSAVFTSGFDFAVLPILTELDEHVLLDTIDELIAARLIEPIGDVGSERYDFVHAIIRYAIAGSLSPSRRARLERNAAEGLLEILGDGADMHAAELAAHFGRSTTLPGADAGVSYALIAADRARRSFDRVQEAVFLRIARDLVSKSSASERAPILCRLAIAEADVVEIESARAVGENAIDALMQIEASPSEVATFYADLITALKHHASAEHHVWRPLLDSGLAAIGDTRDQNWARLMLLSDPVEPVSTGEFRVGRWTGFNREAVAIALESTDEQTAARAVESYEYRTPTETAEYLARVRRFSDPGAVMYGLAVATNDLQYRHGDFHQAEINWEELIAIAARSGAINWQAQATNQVTFLHIARGRFEDARKTQARAIALLDQLGPGRHSDVLSLEMETAFAHELGGDWGSLASRWRAIVSDPKLGLHDPITIMTPYNAANLAYCLVEAGDSVAARATLEKLVPLLEMLEPFDANQNGAVAIAASAAWQLNSVEPAVKLNALLSALRQSRIGDYPQTSLTLSAAKMAALLGENENAAALFAQAKSEIAASGQRPLGARATYDEAIFLQRTRADVRAGAVIERLEEAIRGFELLGMTDWARHAQSEVDTIRGRSAESGVLPAGLSEREVEVLRLVARGISDRMISEELFISTRTVHSHIRNMLNKTGANNRTELSVWAVAQGLTA